MSTQPRTRLRKREILFAVAMGAVAAGGSAVLLSAFDDTEYVLQQPNEINYPAAEFDQIATQGPQDVVVIYGEEFSVRAEGSPRALGQLHAVVENGRLTIGPPPGFNWAWAGMLDDATFHVTLPRLAVIDMTGSGTVTVDRIKGEAISVMMAGSGDLEIGALEVDEADFSVDGPGSITASGTARDARVKVTGSGDIDGEDLRSDTAAVSIGGSGDVALRVEKNARVQIRGGGDVVISGPGRCAVTRMGGGDVSCEGGGGDPD